tara:strand:+ start:31710 stop:33608 length:1899 start_codon:yes stop_codon:yes gene_type:complete
MASDLEDQFAPIRYDERMKTTALSPRRLLLALLVCALFIARGWASVELPPCPGDRDPGLWALMNEAIELAFEESPMMVGPLLGDESRNDELGDESLPAILDRLSQRRNMLARLKGLDRDGFSERDHLAADLLINQWETEQRLAAIKPWQQPISSISGPQVWLPQMGDRVPMMTRQHREDYLTKLKRIPIVIGDQMDNMRAGISEGRVPPAVVMQAVADQAMAQATGELREDPTQSPFFKPLRSLDEHDPIAVEARKVIAERIIPVYQELAVFVQNEYLPACRDTIGASQGVDGINAYNAMIASHTTLPELSADDIYQRGLSEVARIRGEMMAVIDSTDWSDAHTGFLNDDDRFKAFVEYLRTDPRFYYTEPDDLLNGYRAMGKRIDGLLPKLFVELPSLPYGVLPIPEFSAENAPTAFYYPGSAQNGRAGNFMANLTHLDQRPSYEMMALTLHEAMPGHHLQIALAQEIEGQHPIRKTMGFTGYIEGWGLYSEKLGLEMGEGPNGLYDDPYSNFGRLNFEMWRALRLVVDTGMHAKGWSRERAVEFMRSNGALSEHNIEAEINRYIGWPGQATGYKIGELTILELRAQAEEALGESFDIREFHKVVLGEGAMPLPVLRQRISRWIENHQLTD